MARLNAVPGRDVSRAARGGRRRTSGSTPENVVVGAGADDLILLVRADLPRAPGARGDRPADLRALPDRHDAARRETWSAPMTRRISSGSATRTTRREAGSSRKRSSSSRERDPDDDRRRRRGLRRVRRASPCAPWVDELANLVVIRTMSKAFGFAALRVGYALAHPETAALLDRAARSGPDRRARLRAIAAAALRDPRLGDVDATIAERERMRASLAAAGYDVRADGDELRLRARPTSRSPSGSRRRASSSARFPTAIRVTVRRPSENDVLLRALGAEPGPAAGPRGDASSARRPRPRSGSRCRSTGSGRTRVETGIGFLDHLLTLLGVPRRLRSRAASPAAISTSTSTTRSRTCTPRSAAALAQALGAREGVARYGSAVVPMDEARATAAVDLVRRPHAEIALAFAGERVGALRRLARSATRSSGSRSRRAAPCTSRPAGADDHHVAEAAYKALGQALRQAVAPGGGGHPLDEGSGMKVAIADYGAGNLRSLSSALAAGGRRAGGHRRSRRRARRAARARSPASVTSRAPPQGSRGNGLDDALRDTRRSRAAGCRDLRRDAAPLRRRARRAASGLGLLAGPGAPGARTARAAHGLEHARRASRPSASPRRARRRRRLLRPQLRGRARRTTDVVVATADHDGPIVAAVESGTLAGVQFHPERSAPAGARILENLVRWSRSA